MTPDSLLACLSRIPRLPLAEYPTPLERLPRLSQELGSEIYIKRDDGIGPALGGSKTRKLEYLLADALRRGARKVVTFGGLQSNHACLTAAAARKCGLEPHLFYFERRPASMPGNLALNRLFGAHMHFIPLGGGAGGMTLEMAIRLVRLLAWARLGPHYYIPVGGHSWLGGLGYVRAAVEIDQQVRQLGIGRSRLVLAAGSGGTLAGLLAGLKLIDSPVQPLGIDVGRLWKGFPASIARLANELSTRLGAFASEPAPARRPASFRPQDVPLIEGDYVGDGYALPWAVCQQGIQRLACLEGILLDPVYTGKAFAGLLDLVESGRIGRGEAVIFLHTGGLPALFA